MPSSSGYRRVFVAAACTAALVTVATVAAAHDLFFTVDTHFVPPNARVLVRMMNGTFTASEGAVKPERLRDLSVVGAGALRRRLTAKAARWTARGDTATIAVRTGRPGTYVVGASLRARAITLTGEQFNAYLEEDGIPETLERRRERGELAAPARERYAKHVKTLLQVGDERSGGYSVVLGYPAELVPLTNPFDAHAGDTIAFRALVDRKPSAGQTVVAGWMTPADTAPVQATLRADSLGVVRVPVVAAGKWYVKFIHMAPLGGPKFDYESKWATLTFEVH